MNKYIGLTVVAFCMCLVSCDDYLDKLPDNRAALDTEKKIVTLLTSAYPENDFILVNELLADNIDDDGETNPYSTRFLEQVYYWEDVTETNNEDPNHIWTTSYDAIISANQALAAIDELGSNSSSMQQARAEALLCRAYGHFVLVNEFCKHYNSATSDNDLGIPYMTELEEQLNLHHERGTVKEVYENIDKDIQEALPLIGDDNYDVPKFHFNQKAAYAFATRFYLFYEQWDKVVQYASQCLGTNPGTMLRDWNVMATMTQDRDVITKYYIGSSINSNLLLMTAYSNLGVFFGSYTTWKRFSHHRFVAQNETVMAPQVWGTNGTEGYYMTPKVYSGSNYDFVILWRLPYLFEYTDPVAGIGYRRTIYPAFTTDEVLLSRAEAYIMLNQYDNAINDMNLWVHNINKTTTELTKDIIVDFYKNMNYCYEFVDNNGNVVREDGLVSTPKKHLHPAFTIGDEGSDQECLLQCVLCLRRIETLQMGLRWWDIKRYGIEIPRRVMDANGSPAKVTDWLRVNDERRAIQIPVDVVSAGIEPNPRVVSSNDNDLGEELQPININE